MRFYFRRYGYQRYFIRNVYMIIELVNFIT